MSEEQIKMITIHTESFVKGFFGEYRWLSNYEVCDIVYKGELYTSTEAAYHSAKNDDEYIKSNIRNMGPKESKTYSKTIPLRKDWDSVKKQVMYDVLLDKFTRHQYLREKLLSTGSKYLEEANWWGDTYWGVCEGKGKNTLGDLLMKIRNEIKMEEKWI